MGLRKRLGQWLYREESTSRVRDESAAKDAPPTFIPELIQEEVWTRSDYSHLEKVARQDPVAHYITFKIAENVFDDGFKFTDKNGKPVHEAVLQRLTLLDAKSFLTQVLAAERWAGHSWLKVGTTATRSESTEFNPVTQLDWFSPLNCEPCEWDELGSPSRLKIKVRTSTGKGTVVDKYIELPASEFIHVRTRPFDRTEKGRSVLWSVWDVLTYIRFTLHAQSWYDMKVGLGVFLIKLGVTLTEELKSSIEAMLEDISVKRAVLADKRIDTVSFLNAEGSSTAFGEHLDSLFGQVAAGTGIAKDIITGVSAGAITGAEINLKSLYAVINQVQKSMEQVIRELVKRMGVTDTSYKIEWTLKYAHDELEQAQIAYLKSQELLNKLKVMEINEIRQEMGLKAISGGDRLSGDITIQAEGFQQAQESPEAKEQTKNPTGMNT